MKIEKLDLKWNGKLSPLNLRMVDGIALHHMKHPTANAYEVDKWHKDQGWAGFGYGFWVGKDGRVYEGRGFNQNAGVLSHNDHIISIGFQGDYSSIDKQMPLLQYNAGVSLSRWITTQIPSIKTVAGHNYWNSTSCPGQYFPLAKMVEDIVKQDTVHWAEKYFNYLNDNGVKVYEKRFDDSATRGDMFALLARLKGYEE